MFHHYSDALQDLVDELNLRLAKKLDEAKKKKLNQVKRRKAAQKIGTYPAQNRSRRFVDKKKKDRKNKCRKKPPSED